MLQCSAANWAVVADAVGAHAAVEGRAVDSFALVAATLKDADGGVVVGVLVGRGWGGDDCALWQHVGPFALEVAEGGEVLVPRFYVGVVVLGVHLIVEILVAEASEAVAELMDENGQGAGVVGGGDVIAVVDAAAAVFGAVGEHDDMLIGHVGQEVVGAAKVDYADETLHIEEVEEGVAGSLLPDALGGFADAALGRLCADGDDVEAVLVGLEGLVFEQFVGHALGVLIEEGQLVLGVAFGQYGEVYALLRCAGVEEVAV